MTERKIVEKIKRARRFFFCSRFTTCDRDAVGIEYERDRVFFFFKLTRLISIVRNVTVCHTVIDIFTKISINKILRSWLRCTSERANRETFLRYLFNGAISYDSLRVVVAPLQTHILDVKYQSRSCSNVTIFHVPLADVNRIGFNLYDNCVS